MNGAQPPFGTSLNIDGDVVKLESYVDTTYGFLRVEVNDEYIVGKYYIVDKSGAGPASLFETFQIDWQNDQNM